MKIGLVCPYNMYKGGGVQECVLALQAELERRGHQAIIVTPKPRGKLPSPPENMRLVGIAKDVRSPFATTAQVSVSVNNEALDELLSAEDFDLLHFHEPWVPILSWQMLARSSAPTIATFHAKMPDTAMSKTIERAITPYTRSIIKHLDSLTAVSEAAAEYIKGLTEQPVAIVPNGIDLDKYRSGKKQARSGKQMLYIGRLEKRKGVKYLLRAYATLKQGDPGLRLTIVGEGPDRKKLETLAADLKLGEVDFLGYVDEKRKLELLSRADVLVSPALYGESFGIILLEAMAAGVPIVAGDNPGYSSVMQGYGRTSLVNPADTEAFSEKLNLFLNDPALRKKWLAWAAKHVHQFDYPTVVDRYEKLYKKLLAKT